MVRNRMIVALFTALLLVSCSKKEPVKTTKEKKAEKDEKKVARARKQE